MDWLFNGVARLFRPGFSERLWCHVVMGLFAAGTFTWEIAVGFWWVPPLIWLWVEWHFWRLRRL